MKQSDPENSLKAQFTIFRCQKYVKKGYMKMGEQLYLDPLKSAPGRSVFHYLKNTFYFMLKAFFLCEIFTFIDFLVIEK